MLPQHYDNKISEFKFNAVHVTLALHVSFLTSFQTYESALICGQLFTQCRGCFLVVAIRDGPI